MNSTSFPPLTGPIGFYPVVATALAAGAYGVHLGQEDLDSADLAALRQAGVRLGLSTHTPAELARAQAVQPSYLAIGPVYPTTLKVMPYEPVGLVQLKAWTASVAPCPAVWRVWPSSVLSRWRQTRNKRREKGCGWQGTEGLWCLKVLRRFLGLEWVQPDSYCRNRFDKSSQKATIFPCTASLKRKLSTTGLMA